MALSIAHVKGTRSCDPSIRVQALSYQSDLVYVYLVLDEEVSFPTYLGDSIRIRMVRQGTAEITHEQKVRARVAAWPFDSLSSSISRTWSWRSKQVADSLHFWPVRRLGRLARPGARPRRLGP